MHLCQDEIVAITAAVPFVGYLCMRGRQFCHCCANVLRRLTVGEKR